MKKYVVLCLTLGLGVSWVSYGFCENMQNLQPDEQNTINVFQKASPKVVFVNRLKTVKNRSHKKKNESDGAGTGIIWNNRGYVVTNYHVVSGAEKLEITMGKKIVAATVVGKEPRMDLAVLKVDSPAAANYLKSYQPFNIVRVQDIMVGQKAIAIGNPFGLENSLSKGVVSALGRDVPGAGGVSIPMIQTDTAINPGNSGGPLLNSAGELIGITTTIYSRSGASSGIGFAIPADDANQIVNQIITKGRVSFPGIGIHQVAPADAEKLGVEDGVLIAEVLPRSPAALSKLRGTHRERGRKIKGDIIVGLNSHQVHDYNDLYNLLKKVRVGETINLSIQRDNKHMDVSMKTIDAAALPAPVQKKAAIRHTSYTYNVLFNQSI